MVRPPSSPHKSRDALRSSLDDYLRDCFRRESPPRVSEVAQALGISCETLTRACKELLGISPGRFLKHAQTEFAAVLLDQTSETTTSIAYIAAFGSRRTFYRAYRRVRGHSPRRRTFLTENASGQ
jgi:AraC-like DNA-binding protein